jgi:hypothetical protein
LAVYRNEKMKLRIQSTQTFTWRYYRDTIRSRKIITIYTFLYALDSTPYPSLLFPSIPLSPPLTLGKPNLIRVESHVQQKIKIKRPKKVSLPTLVDLGSRSSKCSATERRSFLFIEVTRTIITIIFTITMATSQLRPLPPPPANTPRPLLNISKFTITSRQTRGAGGARLSLLTLLSTIF